MENHISPHSCKEAAVTPGMLHEKTLFGKLQGLPIIWKFIVLLKVVKKILSPPPPLFRHRIAWDNQLHLFGSCSSCFPLIYKLHVFLLIFPSNSSVSTSLLCGSVKLIWMLVWSGHDAVNCKAFGKGNVSSMLSESVGRRDFFKVCSCSHPYPRVKGSGGNGVKILSECS